MRFVVRKDLGGYASSSKSLAALADVEITKPFVLLCGPNGSGKTALLQMLRASIGVEGERAGRIQSQHSRPADPKDCASDLGKLAAFRYSFDGVKLPKDMPGVLDVEAIGWSGQRTWLFDTRAETKMIGASAFDEDLLYHANALVSGAGRVSHGEMLRNGWSTAMQWALGFGSFEDPYDDRRRPPAREALYAALVKGERPAERWLLLDEPELALDASATSLGFSLFLENAAVGKLRVFCASHSPLFAAGLADHPNIQVIDLGGEQSWLSVQRRSLEVAKSPDLVAKIAADVLANIRKHDEQVRAAQEKAAKKAVSDAISRLGEAAKATLLAVAASPAGRLRIKSSEFSRASVDVLENRKLIKRDGFGQERELVLTELGKAGAEAIKAKSPKSAARR